MPNPTVVITHLDDEELKKSINALVATYNKGLNDMVSATNTKVEEMQNKLKTLGSSPMFGGASADGGSSKRTKDLSHEGELIESLAVSYNKLVESIERLISAKGAASSDKEAKIVAPDTIGELEQSIATIKKERKELELNSEELKKQNTELDKRKNLLKEQTTSQATKRLDSAMSLSTNNLEDAQKKLRLLEILQHRYGDTTELSVAQQKKLAQAIQRTKNEIDKIKPKFLKDVLDMDESSVDAIAKKMAALKRVQIDPNNQNEAKKLSQAYQELAQKQNNLLGKNAQVTQSNLSLARSFGYIRNRLVYALTLGAITNFVKQIYEVRGQYEMLERSLGILTDDMRKGTEIFNELNEMALKSPFTLVELGTAAKQLTAYNFAAEEVVDTTRRLADISAALGVPMERLTYNLGQIKAQGVLNARDARDFANAGLAIVPMLAQMYTEQKRFGDEMVTTAQVYDMMSKKMVTYKDVMAVLTKVTDEGGKFFDYQAKQAETLRVKMANLTLAFNNMLNEIGKEEQSTLELPLKSLKLLFENWRDVVRVVNSVVVAYGAYKAAAMLVYVWNQRMAIAGAVKSFYDLAKAVGVAKAAMIQFNVVLDANPIGLITAALGAVIAYFTFFNDSASDATGYIERFGEAGAKVVKDVESLFDSLEGMTQGTSNYKKVMGELNNILEDYGVELVNEKDGIDVINEKRQVAINLIKQEIVERKHLNDLEQGKETYNKATEEAKNELQEDLTNAILTNVSGENVRKNAPAIANIIADVVENNIMEIAGKTGEEYEKGLDKIYSIIHDRMRAIGLSEKEIAAGWMTEGLFYHANILPKYIATVKDAKEAQDTYNESTNKAYEAEKKAAEANTTLKEKVDATSRSLMKSANDTDALYSSINQIIKEYSGLNIIDFLVRVKSDVPKWMMDKSVSELSQLAVKFAALAKNATGDVTIGKTKYTKEQLATRAALYAQAAQQKQANIESEKTTTITQKASDALKEYKQALEGVKVAQNLVKQGQKDASFVTKKQEEEQKAYNKALKAGVSEQELLEAKNGKKKGGGSKKDELGEALSKEVQYINEIQKRFKEYQKDGVNAQEALIKSSNDFGKSIQQNNAILQKFGFKTLSSEQLATMPLQEIRNFYQEQLKGADLSAKGVDALEKAIANLNVEITKVDYKRITDGLNNELSKIKDEYELAIELDANPELGGMFAEMFGIDTNELPQTFREAFDRANKVAKEKLSELKVDVKDFDLLSTKVKGDDKGMWMGIDVNSDAIKDLIKWQNQYRDILKKNLTETEKALDDYVKKYGDYSDKIAEIEADRIEKVKRLNDAYYSEELRKRPEYIAKLNAIEQGAAREKQQVDFEDFKNSRYYTQMFENLDHVSSVTIRAMRDRLRDLIDNMNDLEPEQLKQVMQQYEKLEQKLTKRNPFRNLTKDLKEYIKTTKERRKANQEWSDIDKAYRAQEKVVAAIKVKMEQEKAYGDENSTSYIRLLQELDIQQEILDTLKQQVDEAEKKAQKYNLIKKLALEEAAVAAQMVAGNLTSLGELRDTLDSFGFNLGDDLDAVIDDLGKVGEGINQVTSSATSGNVVGVVSGVVKSVGGLGDSIASIFGGGAAKTKKLNREIARSQESVRQLQYAYQRLEREVSKASGTQETWAKRQQIANKEEEMKELQRQMQLEQSKRSKDRDDAAIKQYEETIDSLWNEIQDLKDGIVNDLLGSDVKSAAQEFVETWVDAWRKGETTLDAVTSKMDDMIMELIKRAASSALVQRLLQPLYSLVDEVTSEDSEGGVKVTLNEIKAIADLSQQLGIDINEALGEFYGRLEQIGAVSKDLDDEKQLSNLQQGITQISETTANALEAYMNSVSQQVYYHSSLLEQIRDSVAGFDIDVQTASLSQILLQLQTNYIVMQSMQSMMEGWTIPSGQGIRVELIS